MLLIDKPVGITSFDVIRKLRARGNKNKLGHAGTLDPLASGLLIILEGSETKQAQEFLGLDKTYEVTARIGEKRTTGDMEGEVIESTAVKHLDYSVVEKTLQEMIGVHELPVPAYSAIKQKGEALYKKARRGEAVKTPEKHMEIYITELNDVVEVDKCGHIHFLVRVSSGTYVRSLVEELGRRLGYPATTFTLRRTSIGEYVVEDALQLNA